MSNSENSVPYFLMPEITCFIRTMRTESWPYVCFVFKYYNTDCIVYKSVTVAPHAKYAVSLWRGG